MTTCKCISKLVRSRPACVSAILLNRGLHVRTITASEWIYMFTRSQCGETVELEGRQPISNKPPHLTQHPKIIHEQEPFWLIGRRTRVRRYAEIPAHDEPHKLCGSMNAWQERVRNHTDCMDLWKLGKGGWDQALGKKECIVHIMQWCLSTPESPQYTRSCWVHLRYPCISVYIYIVRVT